MEPERRNLLRQIPSVDSLLQEPEVLRAAAHLPRWMLTDEVRHYLDGWRSRILAADSEERLAELGGRLLRLRGRLCAALRARDLYHLHRVINATGIVLHTNLGRAPLSEEAIQHVVEVARGYSNVEYDEESGDRGSRLASVVPLLTRLTGAEAALVVNNNAAAVLLCLGGLARDSEVIVSRGELVEIGGSFRIPDVMRKSGAHLVEVGTTNKTYVRDYALALSPETSLILRVHRSNFRIVGFTASPSLEELAELAHQRGLPLMEDMGSGNLVPLGGEGEWAEPTVQAAMAAGVDLVTFSGDKLLGGPQAGIIVGRRDLIESLRGDPLYRALRVDKMTLAALEATLQLYLEGPEGEARIPVLRQLRATEEELEGKARRLIALLEASHRPLAAEWEVLPEVAHAGGGSLPEVPFPTRVVSILSRHFSSEVLTARLRAARPPVVCRVREGRLLLDMRTLDEGDLEPLAAGVIQALEGTAEGEGAERPGPSVEPARVDPPSC